LDHFQSVSSTAGYHYGFFIPVVFTLLGLCGSLLIHEKPLEKKQPSEALS